MKKIISILSVLLLASCSVQNLGSNITSTANKTAQNKFVKYEFDGAYFSLTASEKKIEAQCYLPELLNESDEVTHITLLEQCQKYWQEEQQQLKSYLVITELNEQEKDFFIEKKSDVNTLKIIENTSLKELTFSFSKMKEKTTSGWNVELSKSD